MQLAQSHVAGIAGLAGHREMSPLMYSAHWLFATAKLRLRRMNKTRRVRGVTSTVSSPFPWGIQQLAGHCETSRMTYQSRRVLEASVVHPLITYRTVIATRRVSPALRHSGIQCQGSRPLYLTENQR